jgi:hypothetical protein
MVSSKIVKDWRIQGRGAWIGVYIGCNLLAVPLTSNDVCRGIPALSQAPRHPGLFLGGHRSGGNAASAASRRLPDKGQAEAVGDKGKYG